MSEANHHSRSSASDGAADQLAGSSESLGHGRSHPMGGMLSAGTRVEIAWWLLAVALVAAVAWYARTIAPFQTLPTP